jgi:predicted ester cyclase
MENLVMPNSIPPNPESVVMRQAVPGWGTQAEWRKVWEQTCAPDIVLHFCGVGEPIFGLDAVSAFSEQLFLGFPTIKQPITGVCASGTDVAYRHRLVDANTGPFLGQPATGRTANITGTTWARVEDGRIVEEWYELNHEELNRQLGLS